MLTDTDTHTHTHTFVLTCTRTLRKLICSMRPWLLGSWSSMILPWSTTQVTYVIKMLMATRWCRRRVGYDSTRNWWRWLGVNSLLHLSNIFQHSILWLILQKEVLVTELSKIWGHPYEFDKENITPKKPKKAPSVEVIPVHGVVFQMFRLMCFFVAVKCTLLHFLFEKHVQGLCNL